MPIINRRNDETVKNQSGIYKIDSMFFYYLLTLILIPFKFHCKFLMLIVFLITKTSK